MRLITAVLTLAASLSWIGCSPPGSFEGTVTGIPLSVKEAIFYTQPFVFGTTSLGNAVAVFVSDQTGTCKTAQANESRPNATGMLVVLAVAQGGLSVSGDLTTGSYRLVTAVDAVLPPPAGTRLTYPAFARTDGQCNNTVGQAGLATGGSVTVESFASGKSVSGTFDLQFGTDSGTGTFNATFCDYQPPAIPSPTCTGA